MNDDARTDFRVCFAEGGFTISFIETACRELPVYLAGVDVRSTCGISNAVELEMAEVAFTSAGTVELICFDPEFIELDAAVLTLSSSDIFCPLRGGGEILCRRVLLDGSISVLLRFNLASLSASIALRSRPKIPVVVEAVGSDDFESSAVFPCRDMAIACFKSVSSSLTVSSSAREFCCKDIAIALFRSSFSFVDASVECCSSSLVKSMISDILSVQWMVGLRAEIEARRQAIEYLTCTPYVSRLCKEVNRKKTDRCIQSYTNGIQNRFCVYTIDETVEQLSSSSPTRQHGFMSTSSTSSAVCLQLVT